MPTHENPARPILCLLVGEVSTGAIDPFAAIIPTAKAVRASVHVGGAFGLPARVRTIQHHLIHGIDAAES